MKPKCPADSACNLAVAGFSTAVAPGRISASPVPTPGIGRSCTSREQQSLMANPLFSWVVWSLSITFHSFWLKILKKNCVNKHQPNRQFHETEGLLLPSDQETCCSLFLLAVDQDTVVHSLSSSRCIAADSPFPPASGTDCVTPILHAHPDDPSTAKSLVRAPYSVCQFFKRLCLKHLHLLHLLLQRFSAISQYNHYEMWKFILF